MRTFLICFLLVAASGLFSQAAPDSINKYDDKHKKNGFWTAYLDEFSNPTKPKNALYIGYELYDHGASVFFFPTYKRIYLIEYDGPKAEKGNPVLLNGTLKLIHPNGKTAYESEYRNGWPVLQIAYGYDKNGTMDYKEVLDYSKKYDGTVGTFYFEAFGANQVLTERGYYRKGDKGWRLYKNQPGENK